MAVTPASAVAFLASARKAIVTGLGLAVTLLTFAHNVPFVPAADASYVAIALAVATTLATWFTPNAKNS